jgi:hypothetical protein
MDTAVAQLVAMLDERFDYPAQWDKTVKARITPVRDASCSVNRWVSKCCDATRI